MTQTQQVIEVMQSLGGYATFGKLNNAIDFSLWKTKTPEATVRRIVQDSPAFFRLQPGLWALSEHRDEILKALKLKDTDNVCCDNTEFSHTYYQGLVVEIGNMRHMQTYVPGQDKNQLFLGKPLHEVATYTKMLDFTYQEIVNRARTIDVIWFNERKLPYAFFEIEHSTDIQNSLLKFYELQDFYTKFYIVADSYRHKKYSELMSRSVFSSIKERVKFTSYESLSQLHTQACGIAKSEMI